MRFALEIIFCAYSLGLRSDPTLFSRIHFWFIGTSYAKAGTGRQTILPIAEKYEVASHVTEMPDRIPYFETLFLLNKASVLLVPGSTDTHYTASKIYPYILAEKPLLAVFNRQSSVLQVLRDIRYGRTVAFDNVEEDRDVYVKECLAHLRMLLLDNEERAGFDKAAFEPYTAKAMTAKQVEFFNQVITGTTPE
jgi:hypothetical protein